MAQSHSETSSELTVEQLMEYNDQLFDRLKWMVAINTVLLQEAGGLVEIDQSVLESINVMAARTEVTLDQERGVYIIEGIFEEDEL